MSISEILGTIHDGSTQVWASAEADYAQASQKVSVVLRAFTRRADSSDNGAHLTEPWLPLNERVGEHLVHEEMDEFVKDVFHSWVKKVRASIPGDLPLQP